ncbi:MAG: DUF445 domain-containing protein [Bacteroidota bacterium]
MSYGLVLIPFISAFIGWFTNWILFKMLFHPRNPKKIAGFRFQGIFSKKQSLLAENIGKLVSQELFLPSELEEKVLNPENFQKIMPLVEEHIDDFLRVKLPKQMPMIGMFIGDKTINELKTVFIAELESLFPVIMKRYISNLEAEFDFDFEKMITEKIKRLSAVKLEGIFRSSLSKELKVIGLLSAGVGFLIGLLQVLAVIFL